MSNKLILPPFGKILNAYQDQHIFLNYPIYIHVGKNSKEICFEDVKDGSIASFLPENESFSSYKWPVSGQHIVLVDHGKFDLKTLQKMCICLLKYKPKLIYLFSEDHSCQFLKGQKR